MIRKITRNKHQYKLSLPIDVVRRLSLESSDTVRLQEVDTPMGKGILIIKDDKKPMRIEIK
jgi:hypothetical protein